MPKDPSIKGHIVFDCDGTLISSQEAIFKAIQVLMSETLERPVDRAEVLEKYTADMAQLAARFGLDVENEEVRNHLIKRWTELSNQNEFRYALFEGIEELILKLSEMGYRLYVWTARDRMSTLAILKSLNVAKHFYEFRCFDDTTPKPHPMGLEEMVGEFDRSKTLMIGDSTTDIQGAKSFGCVSVGALWCSFANEAYMDELNVDYKARTPDEIIKIVEQVYS
ncbi:hypothetical protein A9Q84_02760 [Halobacteriovorax marinus]|uniref:phosphoglycolate phosphatase n=1 Tax=Halobacteriovorax marinus TaxID=97084 RepID=A0A1Y5FD68_9BACT|nr:hypothetical protein A9Q84_02760 [Halobacteriovorax marinus]